MPTILERVTKVTAARLGAKEEAVVPSASFTDDLGADSLDLVELIMGLEEEFSTVEKPVKIPDENAAKIKTVQDAVDYLEAKGISWGISNTLDTPPKATHIKEHIDQALSTMDEVSKWYNDEEEANRALVQALKQYGHSVTYQYQIPGGLTVDANVDGYLVEGKLEPSMDEFNRLIGQIHAYLSHSQYLYVVFYGRLEPQYLIRINELTSAHFLGRIFLSYLPSPHRHRLSKP